MRIAIFLNIKDQPGFGGIYRNLTLITRRSLEFLSEGKIEETG
jgi:hypothetical protein